MKTEELTMKKTIAIMMVVILAMGLVMAHGEMRFRTARWSDESDCKIDENGVAHYYVFTTRDGCSYSSVREVSRTIYYELLAEEQADQERHDNLWYVKACRWTSNAANDIADFVVFWK